MEQNHTTGIGMEYNHPPTRPVVDVAFDRACRPPLWIAETFFTPFRHSTETLLCGDEWVVWLEGKNVSQCLWRTG
jgi:hypothetical protein